MSITFYATCNGVEGEEFRVSDINLSNVNAQELFIWLGMEPNLWASDPVRASWLAPLCRRKLWGNVDRNVDRGDDGGWDGRICWGGRRPGYLTERTEQLLAFCEAALETDNEARIHWG